MLKQLPLRLRSASYFLRGGFFNSGEGMLAIGAGSTVGGGSTVNWSNSIVTPRLVRESWAKVGLTDVAGPAFAETSLLVNGVAADESQRRRHSDPVDLFCHVTRLREQLRSRDVFHSVVATRYRTSDMGCYATGC